MMNLSKKLKRIFVEQKLIILEYSFAFLEKDVINPSFFFPFMK